MFSRDLYGFKTMRLDEAREYVADALDLQLEQHDSSYKGLYFCGKIQPDSWLSLQSMDELNPSYDSFREYAVTLDVSGPSTDVQQIRRTPGARAGEKMPLRTWQWPDPPEESDDAAGSDAET